MTTKDLASLHAIVYGHVQGVFFRAFVVEKASRLGLSGYVRNLPHREAVEVRAEGERQKLEELAGYLKTGPSQARVTRLTAEWSEYSGKYTDFQIKY